jgi:glycosyltransferase involved in cell wall biosynthesis
MRVSICTPTFNRRPFFPYLIKCVDHQDYPKELIEWIIIDDGSDKIEDLVSGLPNTVYKYYPDRMTLGRKRNIMHEYCTGDIIIYFDDDDYYPPERISHAVKMLVNNPGYLCAGSSLMYLYFREFNSLYKCGPYGKNRATAASFAFKRELLEQTAYNEESIITEERDFLKNYTIPVLQLDSMKTILVVSHIHNSIDKKIMLRQMPNPYMSEELDIKVDDFFCGVDKEIKWFYLYQLDMILSRYSEGRVENKPEIIEEIQKKLEGKYLKMIEIRDKEIMRLEGVIKNKDRLIGELFDKVKKLK